MPCFKAQYLICGQNKKKTLSNTFSKTGSNWCGCDCCMYQGLNQLGEDENYFTSGLCERSHTLCSASKNSMGGGRGAGIIQSCAR